MYHESNLLKGRLKFDPSRFCPFFFFLRFCCILLCVYVCVIILKSGPIIFHGHQPKMPRICHSWMLTEFCEMNWYDPSKKKGAQFFAKQFQNLALPNFDVNNESRCFCAVFFSFSIEAGFAQTKRTNHTCFEPWFDCLYLNGIALAHFPLLYAHLDVYCLLLQPHIKRIKPNTAKRNSKLKQCPWNLRAVFFSFFLLHCSLLILLPHSALSLAFCGTNDTHASTNIIKSIGAGGIFKTE